MYRPTLTPFETPEMSASMAVPFVVFRVREGSGVLQDPRATCLALSPVWKTMKS